MISGVVVSIIFNWLFVLQLRWGVAGSAWATICGQGTSFMLVMYYFCLSKKAPFKLHLQNLPIDVKIATRIMTLGSASFFLQIGAALLSLFVNNQISRYGALSPLGADYAFAAMGVVGRASMFTFFPIMGCAVAAQPIFGYNYGAKNYQRVKKTFWVALQWMLSFGLFFWTLIQLFPTQIAMAFGVQDDLLAFTSHVLRIQLFLIPIMGLQMLSANFFQSTGQPLKSLVLSMTRQILFMLPLVYLLPIVLPMISAQFIGLDGIYIAYPTSDLLAVLTCVLMMRMEFKKIDKRIEAQEAELAFSAA
jgi:Na+-driven multidrug efflux pump